MDNVSNVAGLLPSIHTPAFFFQAGPRPVTTTTPAPVPAATPKCVICFEEDVHLIRACRACDADYCDECLRELFLNALESPSLFPPRCCSLIQLYTLLPSFGADQAARYREKLEEWLCADKKYCPVPTCSAFISERMIPPPKKTAPTQMPLHERISALLRKLDSTTFARFFRGDITMDSLPRFQEVVANPINLGDIKRKNDSRLYAAISDLANDLVLLKENAKRYNGEDHPVAQAATTLFDVFIEDLSSIPGNRTVTTGTSTSLEPRDIFPCPKCHVAICTVCTRVEHTGKRCDTSGRDSHQLALLQQFGYKQCPRCKQGVRRMYGCGHMQCICGAHWCWWCTRSLDVCPGDCSEGDAGDIDDEFGDLSDEEGQDDDDSGFLEGPQPAVNKHTSGASPQQPTQVPRNPPLMSTNLDAGGAARWEGSGEDFGNEPDEEPITQIWSCNHHFVKFREPDDGLDHGNLDYLECNRCFKSLKPLARRNDAAVRGRLKDAAGVKVEDQAWDCDYCRVIVCVDCKTKYQAARVPP